MTLSLNTLLLCRQVLSGPINGQAERSEIEAVLDARDELDAAIAEVQKPAKPEHNGRVTRAAKASS